MVRARYVIIGFGPDGHNLLTDLKSDSEVVVFVEDERSLQDVRNLRTEAEVVPLEELQGRRNQLDRASAIILLHDEPQDMVDAFHHLKELHVTTPILARAPDPAAEEKLRSEGLVAGNIVTPQRVSMDRIQSRLRSLREEGRHSRLREILQGADSLVVVIQDQPDPDAISSAMALIHIGREINGEDFRGEVVARSGLGREENKTLVNVLGIEYRRAESMDELKLVLKDASVVAMVDCTPLGKNVTFPENAKLDIVIDHHDVDADQIAAGLVDIQQGIGATATILSEYMLGLNITPTSKLATALLYGIRSDTVGLLRNVTTRDMRAVQNLMDHADLDTLDRIEKPDRDWRKMQLMANAIHSSKRYKEGLILISNAGWASDPDSLSYVADELLTVAGVQTAIVFGLVDEEIHIKVRTKDVTLNVHNLLQDAFGSRGGGKPGIGAAKIDLDFLTTLEKDKLEETVDQSIGRLLATALEVQPESAEGN